MPPLSLFLGKFHNFIFRCFIIILCNMSGCIYMFMGVHTRVWIYIHVGECIHMCGWVYIHVGKCIHVCGYTCGWVYTHGYTYTCLQRLTPGGSLCCPPLSVGRSFFYWTRNFLIQPGWLVRGLLGPASPSLSALRSKYGPQCLALDSWWRAGNWPQVFGIA